MINFPRTIVTVLIGIFTLMVFSAYAMNRAIKRANYQDAVTAGHLANQSIRESSGLAASRLNKNILWTVNDGNNKPVVYAIGTDGSDLGEVRIRNTRNRDWEDLSSFRIKNRSFLLIADVGDNFKNRKKYYLYIVREPFIRKSKKKRVMADHWYSRIRFSYEDGPHDCEAVSVDIKQKKILLLTKEEPPALYELDLFMDRNKSVQVARRLTEVDSLPKLSINEILENPEYGPYQYLTTAFDISPDGLKAVILTYKSAYLFHRKKNEAWINVFKGSPEIIPIPDLPQAEAICFGYDGKTLFLTSEKRPTPLLRLSVKN